MGRRRGYLRRARTGTRVSPDARRTRAHAAAPSGAWIGRGAGGVTSEATRLVVWPHHPDVMRRPPQPSHAAQAGDALTWNIFRALQLLPPAFCLRRLHASLGLAP